MNRNKQSIYDFRENAPKPKTIDLWLNKYKPRETTMMIETYKKIFAIETKPKHRHRRSIAKRDLCRLMRGRFVDYYEHKYGKFHRATIIPNPTWEWYLSARACISRRKYYGQ